MANEKHIFIGLGGSGCQTVSQIKEKVYANRYPSNTATKTRLEAMNENYRFIFIDTDQRDIDQANNRNRKSFEDGRVPFINPQSDLVNLGQANPQSIYYEAKQNKEMLINKRILEACSEELSTQIPDQPLGFGAGAFRMKSRIAFAHSLVDFQTKIMAAVSSLCDVRNVGGESCTIFYWVVSSTNGGTGSGIINDVLYHINQIHKQVVGNGDPQLILTMYMPKFYIDANASEEKYALNAFAVFKEIEGFKKMSMNATQSAVMHRMAFVNDYNLIDSKRRYCPFYYLIPIDIQTDKGTSLGNTRVMYRNTAEMLYILHYGAGGDTFRSDIDNYMNDIMQRHNEDFLVPMGYVQLHKPTDQFARYFRMRFERDLLRTWILNADDKVNQIPDSQAAVLYAKLFQQLDSKIPNTIAKNLCKNEEDILDILNQPLNNPEVLDSTMRWGNIDSELTGLTSTIGSATKSPERRTENKNRIVNGLWRQAEAWIKENGLIYTLNALDMVRAYAKEKFEEFNKQSSGRKADLDNALSNLEGLLAKADDRTLAEKTFGSNKEDVNNYLTAAKQYVEDAVDYEMDKWRYDLLGDFCNNEKNDELAKLKSRLLMFKDKVSELNEDAVRHYGNLATEFGNTALDVTTVYLPMLTEICDGNGWKANNFFSRCYQNIIQVEDVKLELPIRESITKLLSEGIYDSKNEEMTNKLTNGQYYVTERISKGKGKDDEVLEECRFFANPNLEEKKPETIVEEFIALAQSVMERNMRENTNIQENWVNKKVSQFFRDLPNQQKDEVRRSLNPALFFNYNSNRIEVASKEEHLVFVAPDSDLAQEMLGYEGSNNRHRFVQGGDANSALVLKSKYGLSLEDYRIYDSLEKNYDTASFREKYHFHYSFAQYLDKITLDNLPDDILPQHRTFAKMLILKEFDKDLKPLFYQDEYEPENFKTSMYINDEDTPTSFEVARPESFSLRNGLLCLQRESNGRNLYDEIDGATFSEQFDKYFELYYNHRFGETFNKLMQEVLRQKKTATDSEGNILKDEDGMAIVYEGEKIIKKGYAEKSRTVLEYLNKMKKTASTEDERRLYSVFFRIIREEYGTVYNFIGQ